MKTNRILYLHGFASGPQSSKARFFAAYFRARGAEIEVPDLADGDFERLTISAQLALIGRMAEGGPVSLIGSSLGGYLAALYAARHPEVRRLVLLAPAFGFARRWPRSLGEETVAEWRRNGVREVYHYGEERPRQLRYDLLEDGEAYEGFPDFPQPALIFHGAGDDVVPAALSKEFAGSHANARLEILDTDHAMHNVLEYMAPKAAGFLLSVLD